MEIEQRPGEHCERRGERPRDQLGEEALNLVREREQDDVERDAEPDQDQDCQDDDAEHVPREAANELPASPEGLTGGAALEDDDRDDQDHRVSR